MTNENIERLVQEVAAENEGKVGEIVEARFEELVNEAMERTKRIDNWKEALQSDDLKNLNDAWEAYVGHYREGYDTVNAWMEYYGGMIGLFCQNIAEELTVMEAKILWIRTEDKRLEDSWDEEEDFEYDGLDREDIGYEIYGRVHKRADEEARLLDEMNM